MPAAIAFCASVSAAVCGLTRHRDRPAVVVDHEHHRQPPRAGDVERLGDSRPSRSRRRRRRRPRRASRARSLNASATPAACGAWRADRHADREILARSGEIAAALVAAPEQEQLDRADAAPQLRAMLAVARQQHVLGPHRAGDADRHRLLAERRGEGAEPAGALQRHRLGVEAPRQHHRAIERDQLGAVAGKIRQRPHRIALGIEKPAVADLEPRHRGRQRRPFRLGYGRRSSVVSPQRHCTPIGYIATVEAALSDMW